MLLVVCGATARRAPPTHRAGMGQQRRLSSSAAPSGGAAPSGEPIARGSATPPTTGDHDLLHRSAAARNRDAVAHEQALLSDVPSPAASPARTPADAAPRKPAKNIMDALIYDGAQSVGSVMGRLSTGKSMLGAGIDHSRRELAAKASVASASLRASLDASKPPLLVVRRGAAMWRVECVGVMVDCVPLFVLFCFFFCFFCFFFCTETFSRFSLKMLWVNSAVCFVFVFLVVFEEHADDL